MEYQDVNVKRECHLEWLLWATGATETLPSCKKLIDNVNLLRSLRLHKLVNRFMIRLQEVPPHSVEPRLQSAVTFIASQEVKQCQKQLRIAGLLSSIANRAGCAPPIVIKGISLYALTGKSHHIRFSSDLDIVVDNPKKFLKALGEQGFSLTGGINVPHQATSLCIDDVTIDIHHFFSVPSYRFKIYSDNYIPNQNPEIWHQHSTEIYESSIAYPDLRQHCRNTVSYGLQEICIPNVEMVVLLICTHLFRHYLYPVASTRLRPSILADLADMRELREMSAFDPHLFNSLTIEFGAQDAVRLAEQLVDTYLRSRSESILGKEVFLMDFPRPIVRHGGWACINKKNDVVPSTTEVTTLVKRLIPNDIAYEDVNKSNDPLTMKRIILQEQPFGAGANLLKTPIWLKWQRNQLICRVGLYPEPDVTYWINLDTDRGPIRHHIDAELINNSLSQAAPPFDRDSFGSSLIPYEVIAPLPVPEHGVDDHMASLSFILSIFSKKSANQEDEVERADEQAVAIFPICLFSNQ